MAGFLAAAALMSCCVPGVNAQTRVPWIPPDWDVTLTPHPQRGNVSVTVEAGLLNTCYQCGSLGFPVVAGNVIYLDTQFWHYEGINCGLIYFSVSTNCALGPLLPGDYTFIFEAWGMPVKSATFTVEPLSLSTGAAQTNSPVSICWNTFSNEWYRLEGCSNLQTTNWAAVSDWIPGDGSLFCTNEPAPPGQEQRFYRVAVWTPSTQFWTPSTQ